MWSNARMANRQLDVDLRCAQVSALSTLAWSGLAWLGSAWLGSARLGSARLGSSRLVLSRIFHCTDILEVRIRVSLSKPVHSSAFVHVGN